MATTKTIVNNLGTKCYITDNTTTQTSIRLVIFCYYPYRWSVNGGVKVSYDSSDGTKSVNYTNTTTPTISAAQSLSLGTLTDVSGDTITIDFLTNEETDIYSGFTVDMSNSILGSILTFEASTSSRGYFRLTPDKGYTIGDGNYYITYYQQGSRSATLTFAEQADGTLLTTSYASYASLTPTYNKPAIPTGNDFTKTGTIYGEIINNIENATIENVWGENTLTLTFDANHEKTNYDRYRFEDVAISYTDTDGMEQQYTPVLPNLHGFSVEIANIDVSQNVTIDGFCGYAIQISGAFDNCIANPTIKEYYIQSRNSIQWTLTASIGDEFIVAPYITYKDRSNVEHIITGDIIDGNNALIDIGDLSQYEISVYIYLSGGATPITVISQYGSLNYYCVNLEILDEFAGKRFQTITITDGTNAEVSNIDLGTYVTQVKRLYCNVPTYGTDNIRCGDYDTNVLANIPRTDIIKIDFGEITIPDYTNDSINLENAEISLFLPFVGFVDLDSDLCGQTISVQYTVNCILAQAVAIVKVGENVINISNCTPCTDIYYRIGTDYNEIGETNWDITYLYGFVPYIVIKHYNSLDNTVNCANDSVFGLIGDFTGTITVETNGLNLSIPCLNSEIEEIKSLLSSGIIV